MVEVSNRALDTSLKASISRGVVIPFRMPGIPLVVFPKESDCLLKVGVHNLNDLTVLILFALDLECGPISTVHVLKVTVSQDDLFRSILQNPP